jgi:hypothetical protein
LRESEKLNLQLDKKSKNAGSDLGSEDEGEKDELNESFETK